MPTGYTSALHDGEQTFDAFVLSCARAFGACIMQRDDPSGVPPKLQEPDTFYSTNAAQRRARAEALAAMTPEEYEAQRQATYQAALASYREDAAKREARRQRYAAMIQAVTAWNPPTEDHKELRGFMLDQLGQSMDFDCRDWSEPEPPSGSAGAALAAEIRKELDRADDYDRKQREENERVAGRNAWIQALYDSLR